MPSAPVPRKLLSDDTFARLRTDEELAALVAKTAHESEKPFSELVGLLVGLPPDTSEHEARELWSNAVTHRRALARALGRPVHLRVAALDLLMLGGTKGPRPLVVSRRLLGQLWDQATTDGLTGLANRDQLLTILGHELRQRVSQPLTLAYLDLDGFKALNDTHGHAAGDQVLAQLGAALRRSARRSDVMARMGGDEFAALLVDADTVTARRVLESARASLKPMFEKYGIGLSVGLVELRRGTSPQEALERADRAMYTQKRLRKKRRASEDGGTAEVPLEQRPVSLYATSRPERYLALQRLFAQRGLPLVPAPNAGAARLLSRLVGARVVVADILFPPGGGQAFLESLEAAERTRALALVAPQRMWSLRGGKLAHPVLAHPFDEEQVVKVVRRALPKPFGPMPMLRDEGQAKSLSRAIALLAEGRSLSQELTKELASSLELDVVKRHLGN